MSSSDPGRGAGPWWSSGRGPQEGMDHDEDPLATHHRARSDGDDPGTGRETGDADDIGRLGTEALDLLLRLAAQAGRRMTTRATAGAGPDVHAEGGPGPGGDPGDRTGEPSWGPHADGSVCEACPVCIALRAVRQVRPEVVGHLADAAHHLSLALQALADAQAGGDQGLEHIDLDP